jgi:Na+/H+-dicarboxylate symporter
MKKLKIGLLPKILICIILGILVGLTLAHFNDPSVWAISPYDIVVMIFVTINGIFSQFLGFAIPLIIVGLVTTAIADIGNKAGKMLLVTVLIAYGSTIFAGLVSYLTGAALFPSMIETGTSMKVASAEGLKPFFDGNIPPLMAVMTALVLAFTLGL